ncbi:hypothetical protein [Marinicrinis lubricantis]|uniref:Uncharacterized protein n=1 Tax=Marinicrinis lubricantis TaxID=2086470 RepID=A0ABW1ITF6_9BACL
MMDHNFSAADYAVIEQALREAMNRGTDYQAMIQYRDVLTKMQGIPTDFAMNTPAATDGFRYDYDDSAGI